MAYPVDIYYARISRYWLQHRRIFTVTDIFCLKIVVCLLVLLIGRTNMVHINSNDFEY